MVKFLLAAVVVLGNFARADELLTHIECSNQTVHVSLAQSDTGGTMSVLISPDKLSSFSLEASGIGMPKDALLAAVVRLDTGVVTAVGILMDKNGSAKKNIVLASIPQTLIRKTNEFSFQAELTGDLVLPPGNAPKAPLKVLCTAHSERGRLNP